MKPFFVVCIVNSWERGLINVNPIKGEIYTVIGLCPHDNMFYYLAEFPEIGSDGINPRGFNSNCFRPVDESFGEYVESTIMKEVELEHALIEQ